MHTFNLRTRESHTFYSSTRKMKTGRDMTGHREEHKAGGKQELKPLSLRIRGGTSCPIWSDDAIEVKSLSSGWLLHISDFSAFIPISDSRFLLLISIRIHAT